MSGSVEIRNTGDFMIMVGHKFLMPGEKRTVIRHHYEVASERYPGKLKILSEETEAEASPADDLTKIEGVGAKRAKSLAEAGITTFAKLAEADPEQLAKKVSGLAPDMAAELILKAQGMVADK